LAEAPEVAMTALGRVTLSTSAYRLRLVISGANEASVRQALAAMLAEITGGKLLAGSIETEEVPSLVVDPVTATIVVALVGLGGTLIAQIVELSKHREEMRLKERELELKRRELEQETQKDKAPPQLSEEQVYRAIDYLVQGIQERQGRYGLTLSPRIELFVQDGEADAG